MDREDYFVVVFENGQTWDYYGDQPIPARAEEKKRHTKIKCILCGRDNLFGEFVPRLCWVKTMGKDDAQLLVQMLERGANSSSPFVVALSLYLAKKMIDEVKKINDNHPFHLGLAHHANG